MEKAMEEKEAGQDDLQQGFLELTQQLSEIKSKVTENKLSMVVFSGDLDKLLAAFIIGTGAVAMGMEVVMFFTFWATPALRDPAKTPGQKDAMGKMFGAMLPKGADKVKLSKMNMGGLGTAMMKSLMQKKNVASLPEMIRMAGELGVKIYLCEMSMSLMGFSLDEMVDYPDLTSCGVATFLSEAANSRIQLFI
jgi:peroxiredoxin family protein